MADRADPADPADRADPAHPADGADHVRAHPHRLHRHAHHRDPEHDGRVEAARAAFWVVCMVSNPVRYKSRYALYRRFRRHILEDVRANLLTVEVALGGRSFQVVDDVDEVVTYRRASHGLRAIDVRARADSVLWIKENAWNVGAAHLPASARYVLFADADVHFCNRHLLTETVHALQLHPVVQPWASCADLGPQGDIMNVHRSFAWCHRRGFEWRPARPASGGGDPPRPDGFGAPWHPGYAIAFRRDVLDRLPLLEAGVLGSGDMHMLAALVGKAALSVPEGMPAGYRAAVLAWERRAAEVVRRDLGFVAGTILHEYHGPKASRQYMSRWRLLITHGYDPAKHVHKNAQGVLELSDAAPPALRDAVREYFAQRDEDANA